MDNNGPVHSQEINYHLANIRLLLSQIAAGRVDGGLLTRELNRLEAIFQRLAHTFEQTQRMQAEMQVLGWSVKVNAKIKDTFVLEDALSQAIDSLISVTGAERGFIVLMEPNNGLMVSVARNIDQATLKSEQFQFSQTVVRSVADSGKYVITHNAREDERYSGQSSVIGSGVRSIIAIPLYVDKKVIGVVYLDSRLVEGTFSESDIANNSAVIDRIAYLIESARRYEQMTEVITQLQQEALENISLITALNQRVQELSQIVEDISELPDQLRDENPEIRDGAVTAVVNLLQRFAMIYERDSSLEQLRQKGLDRVAINEEISLSTQFQSVSSLITTPNNPIQFPLINPSQLPPIVRTNQIVSSFSVSDLIVQRAMPRNAVLIAQFISRVSGKQIDPMEFRLTFGQKSYLVAQGKDENVLAIIGWNLENATCYVDEFYLDNNAQHNIIISSLVIAMEDAAYELLGQESYILLPMATSQDTVQAFINNGYKMRQIEKSSSRIRHTVEQKFANENPFLLTKMLR